MTIARFASQANWPLVQYGGLRRLVSGAGAEYANIGRYDPSQTSSPFLKCSRRFIPSHAWHSAARTLSNHSPDSSTTSASTCRKP